MAANQHFNPYIQRIHKDNLQIAEEVGRGSFGIVYLAYDQNRHHWCAVKCLSVPSDFSSDEKHDLEAEADKMFRIRDDNVINFFGLCMVTEYEVCGLVMPYMRFGSLQRLLRRHSLDFPWPLRIRIVYQIARGMNALHLLEPKVIHLDLKSGNILLTDNLEAKVADFGLARMRRQTFQSRSTTKITGTLSHIPPEYFFENMYRRPTTKFDVYSYGVTVWEVLTRQQPYMDALNECMLSVWVLQGQRPDEKEIPQGVDSKYEVWTTLKDLMFRCWAQEPAERPEFVDVVSTIKGLAETFATEAQESAEQVKTCLEGMSPAPPESAPNSETVRSLDDILNPSRSERLRGPLSARFDLEDYRWYGWETDRDPPLMTDKIDSMKSDVSSYARLLDRVRLGDVYDLTSSQRGRVLIINNSRFKYPLPSRAGAEFDDENISTLFRSLFFETVLKTDLTAREIRDCLKEEAVRPQHKNANAFVLCIFSHGANGIVYGTDGSSLEIDRDIVQVFNSTMCPNLLGKPKLFLIQSCQGESSRESFFEHHLAADSPVEENKPDLNDAVENLARGDVENSIPHLRKTHDLADMLIAYATCPGYMSYRQRVQGSRFIRAIVKEMCEHAHHEHLDEILTRVRRTVHEQEVRSFIPLPPQLTETHSRLLKPLFFFPGYEV